MERKERLKKILREKFLKSGKQVWKNWDDTNIDFDFKIVPPAKRKERYARVIVDSRAKGSAIGRTLIKYPKKVTVEGNENLFDLKQEIIDKVIKHEAIHIGIMDHNRDFDRIATEVGTGISMRKMMGRGFGLEIKEGSRFKEIPNKEFATINEVIDFGRNIMKETNKKVRIIE